MTEARRYLFYAVNGLGLGHVTRLLAIARQIRRRSPQDQILFLTSSEADSVIYTEGFAAFKVPSKTIRAETGLRPDLYAKIVQSLTWTAISTFDPHVLIVDTFPTGSLQELLPVLRWPARTAFVYRAQRLELAQSAAMQQVLPLYDRIIIPHDPGSETIPLPPAVEPRVHWVGPIVIREPAELLDRAEARFQLGLPQDATVVYVSFGGGGERDAASRFHAVIEALGDLPGLVLAVAAGPLFRGRLPDHPAVRRLDRYPMVAYMRAFDVAISAAGYNSAHELTLAGVPTVFVALNRGLDDQGDRAGRMAADSGGEVLDAWDPLAMRTAVDRVRQRGAEPRRLPPAAPSGASLAADVVLALAAEATT
ncbi:MAG: UDP-glucosyltransferase [Candidatus Sericytochromatia bacterium]|nr:UDP-glucosyltransferase [Candidatus Sericytochromatia bacterium]